MDMKQTGVRKDWCLILCAVLVWLLADAGRVRAAAQEALVLCGKTVIPALFPFMTVSAMLISLGFGEWLSPRLAGVMASLFRLPGIAGTALLLGFVGGYPIGARTAADLYRKGLLTREETQRLLTFCSNSNPAFLISVVGVGVFGSVRIGVWLWLIHVLSALLTGILFRGSGSARRSIPRECMFRPPSFPAALTDAVSRSLSGMLSVCAFVVLFYVAVMPLRTLCGRIGAVLTGTVELFSLSPLLTADCFGFLLAAFCSGWGGLSVLAQTAAVLDGTDLRLVSHLAGKAVQGMLSLGLAGAVWLWIL